MLEREEGLRIKEQIIEELALKYNYSIPQMTKILNSPFRLTFNKMSISTKTRVVIPVLGTFFTTSYRVFKLYKRKRQREEEEFQSLMNKEI